MDRARLAAEAAQFEERDWRKGVVALVAPYGDPANPEAKGPMRATKHLARCAYVRELLAALGTPVGRTRFVRALAEEVSYYALTHVRTAIELEGAALVIDTSVIPSASEEPGRPGGETELQFEQVNLPIVMSPAEQHLVVQHLTRDARIEQFLREWRELWSVHRDAPSGWSAFAALRDALDRETTDERVRALLLRPALNPDLAAAPTAKRHRRIERPVFVVAPRGSGATALVAMLARSREVFTASGVELGTTPFEIEERFYRQLRDRNGSAPTGTARMVTIAPKGSIRLLRGAFPDALFVYLYRDPRAALAATRASWSAAGDAAQRWSQSTGALLDELLALPPERWCIASYDQLRADPRAELARLCEFVGFEPEPAASFADDDPPPLADDELAIIEPATNEAAERARELFARAPAKRIRVDAAASFRSVHTGTFAEILHGLGASLIVTTYQSGRVMIVRAEDAGTLNTHLKTFPSPMGVAVARDRIALGTRGEIHDYRNLPDLAVKLQPARHDACFVPRNTHFTGDIRIHEIGFAGGELWVVNTRFSALCTIDREHSFVPRWTPPFITALAAEDRCHLNGMTIVEERVRYVTALGTTDTDNGWREQRARGGVVIDVDSGETLVRGLSMPHSPRMHDGRFFVLESGKGTLATADLTGGRVETIAELPGFTRGLAIAGPFAFVGLSQVRASNIFGGIPLIERVEQRQCGVWVVDLRTGQTVAFLRFEGAVQEIFDVQLLPFRFPELLEPTDPLIAGSVVIPR